MELLGISIEEWFTYHPPKTEWRKKAHLNVNTTALEIGKAIVEGSSTVDDLNVKLGSLLEVIDISELKVWVFDKVGLLDAHETPFNNAMKVQQIRMVCNQAIAIREILETV